MEIKLDHSPTTGLKSEELSAVDDLRLELRKKSFGDTIDQRNETSRKAAQLVIPFALGLSVFSIIARLSEEMKRKEAGDPSKGRYYTDEEIDLMREQVAQDTRASILVEFGALSSGMSVEEYKRAIADTDAMQDRIKKVQDERLRLIDSITEGDGQRRENMRPGPPLSNDEFRKKFGPK